jgi:hypothetical protein
VIMEDRFSTVSITNKTPDINKAKANMAYLKNNYFNNSSYIRQNAGADPLVGVFGPITFDPANPNNPGDSVQQWTQILAEAGEDVDFVTLWYEKNDAGANADGEYAWIYEEESADNHLTHQSNFYRFRAPSLDVAGGVAYPGFNDYYAEGGLGNVVPFEIPHDNGQTLNSVLDLAETYASRIDFLQLATFNDFGEGTMFEPTIEAGFEYLKQIQQFTGVSYGETELQLVYRLYLARKKYAGNAAIQSSLDEVSNLLTGLNTASAWNLLNSTAPSGDYDADGDMDASDYAVWRSKFGTSTILYGSGADGTYDGIVNASDYVLWRKFLSAGPGGGGSTTPSVPEPLSSALWAIVAVALCSCHRAPRTRMA